MHSTLNSQNIDIFLSPSVVLFSNPIPIENAIFKRNIFVEYVKKAFRHEKECQQHPVFPGGHPSKY